MKNIKLFTFIVVVLFSHFILSCTTNNDTTVVLLGEETYVKDIYEIIPDTLMHHIEAHTGNIHSGHIPPNIEGEYILSPKQRIFSNISNVWNLDVIEPDVKITIYDQHNRICGIQINELNSTITDTAYISGNENFFSLYLTEDKIISYSGYDSYISRNIIITGEMTENGIKDLYMSSIIMDTKDNSNGAIIQYKKGDLFIYKDSDSLSERIF